MAAFDRDALLEQLARLDDADDDGVSTAARMAQEMVDAVDGGWATVIPAGKDAKAGSSKKRAKIPTGGDIGETIAALLARSDISSEAREDLIAFQTDQAEGRLDGQDEAYIRALASRLS